MVGRRYAVLIGNGTFQMLPDGGTALPPLRCAAEDVRGLEKILSSEKHGGYEVVSVIDKPYTIARTEVYRALKAAGPDDLVLIYYSGHGKLDEHGSLYLAGSDTDPQSVETTAFGTPEIRTWVANSAAAVRIIILDCCYSGAVFTGTAFKGERLEQAGQALRKLDGRGTFYLTASTDTQLAQEIEGDQFSVLTKHIVEGIRGGGADGDDDGRISFHELCKYVQGKVLLDGNQRPLYYSQRVQGDPIVALTGKPAQSERKKEVVRKLYDIAARDLLSDQMISSVLMLLNNPNGGSTVIESLHSARNETSLFIERVIKLSNLDSVVQSALTKIPEKQSDSVDHREMAVYDTSDRIHPTPEGRRIGDNVDVGLVGSGTSAHVNSRESENPERITLEERLSYLTAIGPIAGFAFFIILAILATIFNG
jgi:hypothetical protein